MTRDFQSQDKMLLREDRIVATIEKLERRISDRFPNSSLAFRCRDLRNVAEQASERATWIGNPVTSLRVVGYATAVCLAAVFVAFDAFVIRSFNDQQIQALELVSAVDASVNILIFFALAFWFLISLERRIKRRRALSSIHELRSIAHVIDMHQLTKDPERVVQGWAGTENSPKQKMTASELNRYLDYCSEMLSLVGKVAAMYVQRFDDAEAVAAVSEVEQLTTGLSRKIWQKIMILSQLREPADLIINTAAEATTTTDETTERMERTEP